MRRILCKGTDVSQASIEKIYSHLINKLDLNSVKLDELLYDYLQSYQEMDPRLNQSEEVAFLTTPYPIESYRQWEPLTSVGGLRQALPTTSFIEQQIQNIISCIKNWLYFEQDKLLVIIGPCSVHDEDAILCYAERLTALRERYHERLEIVMRTYFEKPRSALGWQGFLSDPYRDGSYNINAGLKQARKLLISINSLGLPTATEFLDPMLAPYLSDLIAWGAIGARSTENQLHRNLASGLSMPIGFKNGTDGQIDIAIAAIAAAQSGHSLLWPNHQGILSRYVTQGNTLGHLVLRGSKHTPNDHPEAVNCAINQLRSAGLPHKVIIDCSHGNKRSGPTGQRKACFELCQRFRTKEFTTNTILGVMLESFLEGGTQALSSTNHLKFGQSITDHCLSWTETEVCLDQLAGII